MGEVYIREGMGKNEEGNPQPSPEGRTLSRSSISHILSEIQKKIPEFPSESSVYPDPAIFYLYTYLLFIYCLFIERARSLYRFTF